MYFIQLLLSPFFPLMYIFPLLPPLPLPPPSFPPPPPFSPSFLLLSFGSLPFHSFPPPPLTLLPTQYGFIAYQGEDQSSENIFFHMNSLANGCNIADLNPGDEVEFLITFSQKAQKNSANYVKKLTYVNMSHRRITSRAVFY